jgi:hypothetical protein
VFPNIAQPRCTEEGVTESMQEHIAIAVGRYSSSSGNLHPAEH